jgi:hypothetical protein
MDWVNAGRLEYFGKRRNEIHKQFDEAYGEGNWRIMWRWGKEGKLIIHYLSACRIYEDAYFIDSFKREEIWHELSANAKNIFDYDESDIESGLDYLIQKGPATHIQDIAIRNVFFRRGQEFEGKELIQIRSHSSYWGQMLSPGRVPFHLPEMIIQPHQPGWWENNSVECWYQDAKVLQIKKQ